jgi:hydrogenase large subunit
MTTTRIVSALAPAWGTQGVYAAYYPNPNAATTAVAVAPGTVETYLAREGVIVKAGQGGLDFDEGLVGFKPTCTLADVAAASGLTFDVAQVYGTNPVWVRMELDTGTLGNREDNPTYQFVPSTNPAGWHTVDAGAGSWQLMTADGNVTGSMLTLASLVTSLGGTTPVVRVYLTLGQGPSYRPDTNGTVARVDNVVIGSVAYDFVGSATFEVDPISRIEGHLGVKVTVDKTGTITEADVHGNLFRGFENFLIGRRVNDAITFTQRICGVCPIPHGTAATFAADSVLGVSNGYMTFAQIGGVGDGVPKAAVLVRNIVLASEFLMSSLTHFYHLVAQSYVQGPPIPPWTPYFPGTQYHPALLSAGKTIPVVDANGVPAELWSAVIKQYVKALRIRRLALEAGALFAGRMPMMSNSVAGGTTNRFKDQDDFFAKCDAYKGMLSEVGRFVISEYIPLALALSYLYPEYDNFSNTGGHGYGAGLGNFLAWGAFPGIDDAGTLAVQGGVKVGSGAVTPLLQNRANLGAAKAAVEANLKEFISRSRYANTHGYSAGVDSAYPGNVDMTEPSRDDDTKYSWMKAPRWNGLPMEVGPLARMVINGKYLVDGGLLVNPSGAGAPKAYADLYTTGSGLDTTVLHPDLVAGLVGTLGGSTHDAGATLAAVGGHILGLKGGLSTMDRLRGRAIESFWMVAYLIGAPTKGANSDAIKFVAGDGWIDQLKGLWTDPAVAPKFYRDTTPPVGTVSGYGLTEAPRGALGHFVTASNGKINSYQCVVPTTWNGSPKDGTGVVNAGNTSATKRGAIEQAMIGVPFDAMGTVSGSGTKRDALSGVEVLRVAQSFDPCIACAVH